MIQNEVNHDDDEEDDGRQFSMGDLSTHSRFAMAFDLKPPDTLPRLQWVVYVHHHIR